MPIHILSIAYMLLAVFYLKRWAWLKLPCLCGYFILMAIHYALWNPWNVPHLIIAEPVIAGAKLLVAIEAFIRIAESVPVREKRALFAVPVAVGIAGILAQARLFTVAAPIDWYRAIRQNEHLGIALACVACALCLRTDPWKVSPLMRKHGLILTIYFCVYAVTGWIPKRTLQEWEMVNWLFLVGHLPCLMLWAKLKFARPRLLSAGLQTILPELAGVHCPWTL